MRIDAPSGTKVKCIDYRENTWGGCDQPVGELGIDQTYTVDRTEIHSWHTKVVLKERPDKKFNSIIFEEVG